MAFAAACRWWARRLCPPDPEAVADRPSRGRRRAAAAGSRAPSDGRDAAILPRAIPRPAGDADRAGPFGAVLSQLRVRADRRALRRFRGGTCRYEAQVGRLSGNLLGDRYARDLVGLQRREYLGGKAADLVHEQLVRQHPAIEADLHGVGAGTV